MSGIRHAGPIDNCHLGSTALDGDRRVSECPSHCRSRSWEIRRRPDPSAWQCPAGWWNLSEPEGPPIRGLNAYSAILEVELQPLSSPVELRVESLLKPGMPH